jgi:hypothetical protein
VKRRAKGEDKDVVMKAATGLLGLDYFCSEFNIRVSLADRIHDSRIPISCAIMYKVHPLL